MAGTAFSAHIKDLVTEVLHQTNYLKWVHLIQLVIEMYDLFGHIDGSESHLPEFNVSSDVADAWITLKNYFFHQSTAREMQYKHQLHTIKKEDLSTDAYMSKIQELADCLHSIGRCVNDSELVRCDLNGLPLSYDSFVIMASHMSPAPRHSELWMMLLTH
ncbi:uncharacterized protein [Nicotiana tomentosiformis]|uniref:uncharacterized protein n=1 Tax=Nicotiana tomentosiformis TaxID=4098 RepID=UPI00388C8522